MKQSILKALSVTTIVVIGISGYFFGTSILENAHLSFIRFAGRDVVYLLNERGGGGTGFVTSGNSGKSVIMTNDHICRSSNNKPLLAIYRGDKYIVQVIRSYPVNDLCAVTAPSTTTSGMTIAKSVEMGERVYAIGHPLLEPVTVTEGELSSTIIISIPVGMNVEKKDCTGSTYRLIDLSDNILANIFGLLNYCVRDLVSNSSTVIIHPGNSGSPVVNIYGNVVGVAYAAIEGGAHSYIVPLSDLQTFLGSL